jgi:hypothetical protein
MRASNRVQGGGTLVRGWPRTEFCGNRELWFEEYREPHVEPILTMSRKRHFEPYAGPKFWLSPAFLFGHTLTLVKKMAPFGGFFGVIREPRNVFRRAIAGEK